MENQHHNNREADDSTGGEKTDVSERLIRAEFAGFAHRQHLPEANDEVRTIPGRPLRIVIADDYQPIRKLIADLVRTDFDIVAEAVDGPSALQLCMELKPDVTLLDIEMPGISGFQVAEAVKRLLPNTYIIFMSQHNDQVYVTERFRVGAHAYVRKASLVQELGRALQAPLAAGRIGEARPR